MEAATTVIFRDTAFGQLVRFVSRNKYFQYPEERLDFELPLQYTQKPGAEQEVMHRVASALSSHQATLHNVNSAPHSTTEDVEAKEEQLDPLAMARTASKVYTAPYTRDRFEAEEQLAATPSIPVIPRKTQTGVILVDWYTTDDLANPQNWPAAWKAFVIFIMCTYTWVIYTASSIIAPATEGMMRQWHIDFTDATLPLALYVLAYSIAPLLFGPLSEIPVVGRNPIYIVTFFIFFALCVPTAVVNSFASLLVLRFLTGFFGSPALANAGATFSDLYSLIYVPYQLGWWVWSAWAGPALGFLLAAFAVTAENWHWSLWEVVWMSAPMVILLFFFLPETSSANILLRRAKRLRRLTGNNNLQAQSEIDQRSLNASSIAKNALIKPTEIMFKDPAILFVNLYTGLFYGIYYTFFECFPLVFPPMYGFNLGETGLAFLACQVGATLGLIIYFAYLYWYMVPDNLKNGLREQEHRLVPGILGAFLLPIGLFMFAWTARPSIHWIVPLIGVVIFVVGFFLAMQILFVYLPLSYPKYAASLFTANDLCRSLNGTASVLYARPLFINLGVDGGVSLLGGLTVIGIFGMIWLYFGGKKLRAMSKFAEG